MRRAKTAPPRTTPGPRETWVPIPDVARRLGLTDKAVYDLCDAGDLGHIRHKRAVRVSEYHLAEYLKAHECVPAAAPDPVEGCG